MRIRPVTRHSAAQAALLSVVLALVAASFALPVPGGFV